MTINNIISSSLVALTISLCTVDAAKPFNPGDKSKTRDDNITGPGIDVGGGEDASGARSPGLEISGGTSFNAYMFKNRIRDSRDTRGVTLPGGGAIPNSILSSSSVGTGDGKRIGVDDSRINFEVGGKADERLGRVEYSFLIGMTGNTESGKTSVEENRIKLKNRFGTLILGASRGVTDFMAVGAFNIVGGTGGILGNYKTVVSETTGVLIRDDLVGVAKNENKATIVSPRYGNIQVGYSFTPNGRQRGESKQNSIPPNSRDNLIDVSGRAIHEIGANFKHKFENSFGINASITGVFNDVQSSRNEQATFHDAGSYALGLVMTYQGFSFGGEFLDNRDSFKPTKTIDGRSIVGNDAGKMYSIGTGYAWDRYAVSLAYMNSDKKLGRSVDNQGKTLAQYGNIEADVFSVTGDLKLAKGLKTYIEFVQFDYKAKNSSGHAQWVRDTKPGSFITNNNGHSVVLGTAISF